MPKAAPFVESHIVDYSFRAQAPGMVISVNINKTLLCFHSMQHIEGKGLLIGYGYSLNFN